MFNDFPSETVTELQARGILEVADGNHGNDRPRPDEFGVGNTAFIRAADMDGGRVLFDSAERINDIALVRIRKGKGKPGDILFSSKGTVGKLALVQMNASPFVCSPQTTYWRTLDEKQLDRTFLYAFMQSSWFIEQWEAIKGDTDMAPYASLTSQRQFRVPLPDIKFQRNVASVFRPLDDKLELNRRMNRTLEGLAAALFRSWFVDFDPVVTKAAGRQPAHLRPELAALFPAHWQDSPLGPIPHGWRVGGISDISTIASGGTPKTSVAEYWNGDIPWFSVVDTPATGQVFVLETEKTITQRGLDESSANLLPEGTTIITARGTVGNLALVGMPMAMNQSCYAMIPKSGFSAAFVFFAMQNAVEDLQRMAHGSVFDTITRTTVDSLSLPISTPEILTAFDTIVSPWLAQIKHNVRESRTLAALRDTLLPKLLSGELRVKPAKKLVEAHT
jgi:type I restriction enzyme S subunit